MNLALKRDLFIEGVLARWMYKSLYKMHERALHGVVKTTMGTLARGLSRRVLPKVKLH
jgi:NADH dehydrogenase